MSPVNKLTAAQERMLRAAVLDEREQRYKDRLHFFGLGALIATAVALVAGHVLDLGLVAFGSASAGAGAVWMVKERQG